VDHFAVVARDFLVSPPLTAAKVKSISKDVALCAGSQRPADANFFVLLAEVPWKCPEGSSASWPQWQ